MIDQNSIGDVVPLRNETLNVEEPVALTDEHDAVVATMRQLSEEEFQRLAAMQEKIIKDHNAKQVPTIQQLFPHLKMYKV